MTEALHPAVLSLMQDIGISDPNPRDPLHVRLVNEAIRVVGESRNDQFASLYAVLANEYSVKSADESAAKTEYEKQRAEKEFSATLRAKLSKAEFDRALAEAVVAAREGGERNANVARQRAMLMPDVQKAQKAMLEAEVAAKALDADDELADMVIAWETAKQLKRAVWHKMETIKMRFASSQTNAANARAADTFHSRTNA